MPVFKISKHSDQLKLIKYFKIKLKYDILKISFITYMRL